MPVVDAHAASQSRMRLSAAQPFLLGHEPDQKIKSSATTWLKGAGAQHRVDRAAANAGEEGGYERERLAIVLDDSEQERCTRQGTHKAEIQSLRDGTAMFADNSALLSLAGHDRVGDQHLQLVLQYGGHLPSSNDLDCTRAYVHSAETLRQEHSNDSGSGSLDLSTAAALSLPFHIFQIYEIRPGR